VRIRLFQIGTAGSNITQPAFRPLVEGIGRHRRLVLLLGFLLIGPVGGIGQHFRQFKAQPRPVGIRFHCCPELRDRALRISLAR
jgi:hypothetical protein